MSIYVEVNADLQTSRYCLAMVEKRRKPGSALGVSKPVKRALDQRFSVRLNECMIERWPDPCPTRVSLAAKAFKCERATLHNYLKLGKKSGDPLLILAMADYFKVEHRWLLTGKGPKRAEKDQAPVKVVLLRAATQLAKYVISMTDPKDNPAGDTPGRDNTVTKNND